MTGPADCDGADTGKIERLERKHMKENRYDDAVFFEKYSQVNRSRQGLSGAGEWGAFKKLLPDFARKRVLDLG